MVCEQLKNTDVILNMVCACMFGNHLQAGMPPSNYGLLGLPSMAKPGGHYILPPVYFFFLLFFFLISIKDLGNRWGQH